jgi:hypothetical protein
MWCTHKSEPPLSCDNSVKTNPTLMWQFSSYKSQPPLSCDHAARLLLLIVSQPSHPLATAVGQLQYRPAVTARRGQQPGTKQKKKTPRRRGRRGSLDRSALPPPAATDPSTGSVSSASSAGGDSVARPVTSLWRSQRVSARVTLAVRRFDWQPSTRRVTWRIGSSSLEAYVMFWFWTLKASDQG